MDYQQALRVSKFNSVPSTREGLVQLLKAAGYRQMGGHPFDQCPRDMLLASANHTYHRARKIVAEHPRELVQLERNRDQEEVRAYWPVHLQEIFNDSETPPEELEKRLLES